MNILPHVIVAEGTNRAITLSGYVPGLVNIKGLVPNVAACAITYNEGVNLYTLAVVIKEGDSFRLTKYTEKDICGGAYRPEEVNARIANIRFSLISKIIENIEGELFSKQKN